MRITQLIKSDASEVLEEEKKALLSKIWFATSTACQWHWRVQHFAKEKTYEDKYIVRIGGSTDSITMFAVRSVALHTLENSNYSSTRCFNDAAISAMLVKITSRLIHATHSRFVSFHALPFSPVTASCSPSTPFAIEPSGRALQTHDTLSKFACVCEFKSFRSSNKRRSTRSTFRVRNKAIIHYIYTQMVRATRENISSF